LQASNPVLWSTVLSLAFFLTKRVGGILFGIAFWVITKNIHKNSLVRSYMIISASGLVLLFTCNQAIALTGAGREIPYPPFGLASVCLVGFSCYLILIGIYFSAISLSEDSKLRQSIRTLAIGESKLLDSIGTAQMEQEIERRVVVLVKQNQYKLTEESGVESSLTDQDIRQYLEEVIKEVKEAKEK
jgi:hypothetical protein